jgi:hypothetical protein
MNNSKRCFSIDYTDAVCGRLSSSIEILDGIFNVVDTDAISLLSLIAQMKSKEEGSLNVHSDRRKRCITAA